MNIESEVSLKAYNTFGIEATARHFVQINSVEELQEVLRSKQWQNTPKLIVGGGSNLLFTRHFDGLVIKMSIQGIEVVEENEESVWVRSGAGENWHELVMYCIEHGWGGVENLSLIPGTVGAAPMQNIGAYGVEIKDVFESLEAINSTTGDLRVFTGEECKFGYRESVFKNIYKGQYIITSVVFKLSKKPVINTSYGAIESTLIQRLGEDALKQANIRDVSEAVMHIRRSKLPDPSLIGNAGSFFKNPIITQAQFEKLKQTHQSVPNYPLSDQEVKIPAGWLIEQAGWKGKRFGSVGVHEQQALVLVNHGGATGESVKKLALDIQASVKEKFGVEIEPEVNMI